MDLLGRPLVFLLAGLAVGLPAATYLLWSRVRGPRALRAATRMALLGLSQVTAVLLVAAAERLRLLLRLLGRAARGLDQ
jgi:hypothetical protein